MRIKLGENIPARLRAGLSNLGHDVDTVIDEGLTGKDDETVWSTAQREQRVLSIFSREPVERWAGCFIVVTENKLRIRHPLHAT